MDWIIVHVVYHSTMVHHTAAVGSIPQQVYGSNSVKLTTHIVLSLSKYVLPRLP